MKVIQKAGIAYIRLKFKVLSLLSKKKAAEQAFILFCTPFAHYKRKVEPDSAEKLSFIINNTTIKGHRWNYPQPKKALVLHGFSSAAHKFDGYINMLLDKGYEVLAFDAPAHGHSDGKMTNAVEYMNAIKKIVELYGPIDSFIAHSFGGIALGLAMEQLPHDAHTKIVFIAPATETTSAIDGAFNLLKIKDPQVRHLFNSIVLEKGGQHPEWFSIRRAAHQIKAQILWIHDEDDDITPIKDALKVQADNHPNIQFIITKKLGHRKIYHDTAVKKAIENFV
jgi:pimeloyl-ACP methyl ester carboxylesterase